MNNCICCHHRLLRHLNHNRVYWFCPHCHQEMPNVDSIYLKNTTRLQKVKFKKYDLII